jgi:hypothetical protein
MLGGLLRDKLSSWLADRQPLPIRQASVLGEPDHFPDSAVPPGLLFTRQTTLFGPFMLGRIRGVLMQGPPGTSTAHHHRRHRHAGRLYRTPPGGGSRIEKARALSARATRPVPLFIQGVGTAVGPYRELIRRTLGWLEVTDESSRVLDLARLQEWPWSSGVRLRASGQQAAQLSFRSVGPHGIDQRGFFCRFVVQQTMDALLDAQAHAASAAQLLTRLRPFWGP